MLINLFQKMVKTVDITDYREMFVNANNIYNSITLDIIHAVDSATLHYWI